VKPLELPICACGAPMVEYQNGAGATSAVGFRCENCDRPTQEGSPKTPRDHEFHLTWAKRIRAMFPGQPLVVKF